MDIVRFFNRLPPVIKVLYALLALMLVLNIIWSLMGRHEGMGWISAATGILLIILGLILVPNLFGTARKMADAIKTYHPAGIDYSKSFLATPMFPRLFGAMAIIVGSLFLLFPITEPAPA